MENEQKQKKEYLGVYGQGLTYVVGNIVPAWRNISAGKDKPSWTLERPEDKENWARNLVLIDVTGGMNLVSPYPERKDGTNPYIRTMIQEKMKELRTLEQEGKKSKLYVLRHISGKEHTITPLEDEAGIPAISRQLDIGNKFGVFTKANGKEEWRLDENAERTRTTEALPAGVGATGNVGKPLIPMLVTGYESVKFKEGDETFKIKVLNPMDLKKEEFWLKGMPVNDKNREFLERLRFSFRMFESSKYVEGHLLSAKLITNGFYGDWEQYNKKFDDRLKLADVYWKASNKARHIAHIEKKDGEKKSPYLKKVYSELRDVCEPLFRNKGFLATLGHTVEITRGIERGKRLAAIYDRISSWLNDKSGDMSLVKMKDAMMDMAAFWDVNKHLEPGRFDYVKETEMDLSVSPDARGSALLTGIRRTMGDEVYVDKQKRGLYIRLATDINGNTVMVFPKGYSSEKLVDAVSDELNKLRNTRPSELYMSTGKALSIISPFMAEKQSETVNRLGKMIDDGIERYREPNEKGLVLIPTYRSGYIRKLKNDTSIQVRSTIADTWVRPETMHRYVSGLKEWIKRNGMDVPVVIESKGGMEAAELTRHVLKTRCGIDDSQKIALLEKIKGEIAEEINLQKKTNSNKASKEHKEVNAKNKNNILR